MNNDCRLLAIFVFFGTFSTFLTQRLIKFQGPLQDRGPLFVQPEQIHLSLGENSCQIVVTWTTFNETVQSTAWYGIETMSEVAYGNQSLFVDGGPLARSMYIHRVYLNGLQPNTSYKYHVGSTQGWSDVFYFRTFPAGTDWSPRIVVYGDLGNINGRTLGRLQDEMQRGEHDLILHAGDMAYDMHFDNARVGDEFMRQIEPMAAYAPYQVLPGNHERAYNFSNYVNRFSMHSEGSSKVNNHFWSYNIGPAHLIAFCTEFLYYPEYFSTEQVMNQYKWLEEDLKRANKPENRAKHPWIITAGHRAIYTQGYVNKVVKDGNQFGPGFEDLFYKYGVDVELWAHEHIYERIWPIYNNTIYNGTREQPYRNPKAPVHITTGSAGCITELTPLIAERPAYSAFILRDYSFTHMRIVNGTHIHFQQVSEKQGGKVMDDFFVIKEKHGPEAWK